MEYLFAPTLPIDEQVREIKTNLRGTMNGAVSASMREQGLKYRVNFGVDQPYLVQLAQTLPQSKSLAEALWQENIRELRLLAPMVMDKSVFDYAQAQVWIQQLNYAEEAQVLSMHLLSHLPFAQQLAQELMDSQVVLERLVAWLVWGRCFMQGQVPNEAVATQFLGRMQKELYQADSDPELRRTALNTLYKYMDLGQAEEQAGEQLLSGE